VRKILYSPGYGAGWTSWMTDKNIAKFALEYKPLIDALESMIDEDGYIDGELIPEDLYDIEKNLDKCHPAVKQFCDECQEKFGKIPYLGGLRDLCIYEADDDSLVKIKCFDGSESVEICYDDWM
jgi:hypothetical protein